MPTQFKHSFSKDIKLSQRLDNTIATQVIASPSLWEQLYKGLIRFYKTDGSKFAEGELIEIGSKVCAHQPELEGDEQNIYQIVALDITTNDHKTIVMEVIKPTSKAAFQSSQMTIKYSVLDNEAKMELVFSCNTHNESMVSLIKLIYGHVLKRTARLADNLEDTLQELKLITALNFDLSDTIKSHDLPYSVTTEFTLPNDLQSMQQVINSPNFLKSFFENVQEMAISDDKRLQQDDTCKISMKSMSISKVVDETVTYQVLNVDDGISLRADNVNFFRQIGFDIALTAHNDKATTVSMGLFYGNDTKTSVASGVMSFARFFTSKAPDPQLLLRLSARDMVSASARRFLDYLVANNLEARTFLTQSKTPELSPH